MEEVLEYFAQFRYAPTQEEIIKFYPKKVTKISPIRNKYQKETEARNRISDEKEKKARLFIQIAAKIPWVKLLGYSGSVAMRNASELDDIDFFVITAAHKLWTVRFLLVVLTFLLGRKRWPGQKKAPDTLCLNLFFDEQDLAVPKKKRSLYTAHEVMQMRPVVNKDNTYERFLWANKWVTTYFPNNCFTRQKKITIQQHNNVVEPFLKWFQLRVMKKTTNETVTPTQLWFFPRDFSEFFRLRGR